jgi:phosphomannomutase / phosphoglucomutase
MLSPEIFRTYDIRGVVGETLTPEIVFEIARAIGSEALDKQQKQMVIARDGRLSGPSLSKALKEGLLATGCNVLDIGAVPTPLLYFSTNVLPTQSGVMLTGSHNPANYNGLKIVIAGETLSEDKIQQLYQRIQNKNFAMGQGDYQQQDIQETYLARISGHIRLMRPLKIVVDAGSGIAGRIAPQLYQLLGCDVVELFCDVDGNFPHHHPDPSVPENLQDLILAVKTHQADVGFAFDGDGDRLGVVTNNGEIIWPDRQIMLYAKDVLSRHPNSTIIFDVKCSKHLAKVIEDNHGQPLMWKTGHSLIKRKMRNIKAALGGEMSGHIFFKERWYGFDDALYAGARLLEIIAKEPRSVSEVFQNFPDSINTPELKLAVTQKQRESILRGLKNATSFKNGRVITIDGIRVEFKKAWGLIRGSNTTPHLILRFEADDQQSLSDIQHVFRQEILQIDNTLKLPF